LSVVDTTFTVPVPDVSLFGLGSHVQLVIDGKETWTRCTAIMTDVDGKSGTITVERAPDPRAKK
jgi:hypothetical protein